MKGLLWLAVLPCLGVSALAQSSEYNYDTFCNDGIIADGYVDFNDMPPAPTFSKGGYLTPPITATLPVHGIPGLTVQVQVPSIAMYGEAPGAYQVQSGAITFLGSGSPGSTPGSPLAGNGNSNLSFQFSAPVKGVGVNISQPGRFAFQFYLSAGPELISSPLFENSINAASDYLGTYNLGLQAIDRHGSFSLASLAIPRNEEAAVGATFSNFRVQSLQAEANAQAAVPKRGLSYWLRADGLDEGTADGRTCRPTYNFGAGNSPVQTHLSINGWREMTVFLVASAGTESNYADAQHAALFWQGVVPGDSTFLTPLQTKVAFRFGAGLPTNALSYRRQVDVGADYTITRAVHNYSTDSLYVDGRLSLQQGGKAAVLSGSTGTLLIGQGLNGTPFPGRIAEVLVYNRVLADEEAVAVEQYLHQKFRTN